MDNEEIKNLLQELKESSDDSSSVRSKVVKIHFDTPEEAKKREREKRKAEEREARKRQEEEQRAQEEEEARRLEAEKAAQEAVEEAKKEAKAGFASDLDKDLIQAENSLPEGEEPGEDADDLDLNWDYEKPELKSGFAKDEDFDIGGSGKDSTSSEDSPAKPDRAERRDEEDDFESDEDEFRSDHETEGESITGLPGLFGAISDKVLSFAGGIHKSVKEDLSKVKENKAENSIEAEDSEEKESAPKVDADEEKQASGGDDSKEMHELPSYWDEDFADEARVPEDFEETGSEKTGSGKAGSRKTGSGKANFEEADSESLPDTGEEENLSEKSDGSKKTPAREYGPDEEWKRRLEEPPKKKSFFEKLRSGKVKRGLSASEKKEKKPRREKKEKRRKKKEEPDQVKKDSMQENMPVDEVQTGSAKAVISQAAGAGMDVASETASGINTGAADSSDIKTSPADAFQKDAAADAFQRDAAAEDFQTDDAAAKAGRAGAPADDDRRGIEETPSDSADDWDEPLPDEGGPAETAQKSIEVINLNENQNNKDAHIIPLTGDTGPLPVLSDNAKANSGFSLIKRKFSGLGKKHKETDAGAESELSFFATHRKLCLISVCLIVVLIILIAAALLIKNMPQARKALIEADEGLTVRILEQPEEYTDSGDVKISVSAPETIQSITVNGENVVVDQSRNVDFTYYATGGTLDVMAVSTDKVRSAKVVLAYVDSAPPAVTIKEKEGKIVLSAKDTESGVEGIYIGKFDGMSQIPQYTKYDQPLDADPDTQIMYYAKDAAGNSSVPVLVALTPAKSIELNQERYTIFPGSTVKVELITTPENAFVNNLSIEAENPKVVQVEGGLQLKGLAEGDTKITVTADGISGVMASVSVSNERTVTISAVGDCTLGTDQNFSQNNSFTAYESLYGYGYFFEKVKGILSSDDSTFANLEGTFTTSDQRGDKIYAFKGDPSYTQILKEGSIDTVTLANNHCDDFGEAGIADTQKALEDAGIEWCKDDHIAYRDLNGVLTAYIGIYALENGLDTMPQVKSTIAEAKKKGAELIIIEFHWGAELVAELDEYQTELAHAAVDAGANLVLGSHAHVLQAIEKYNGAYIVYGLSNFCFGGNVNPTSYDTIIWRQTFTFTADGLASEDDIAIIPCQISGDLTSNNYQPVPVSGEAAQNIMNTIDNLSSVFGQSYSQYMVDGTLWTAE